VSKDPRDKVILGWRGRPGGNGRACALVTHASCSRRARKQCQLAEALERHRLRAALWSIPKLEQPTTSPYLLKGRW